MAKSLAFEMAGFVHTAFTVYTVVQFRANFVYAKWMIFDNETD